jgi:hypothetical protein
MSAIRPIILALMLGILWAVLAAILLIPGHLAIAGIEADVLHALDGAVRMQGGAVPHLDFTTPLGLLAFGLPALALAQGLGPGTALIVSNLAVALLLLPMLFWLGTTRLGRWTTIALVIWALAEAGGLVHDAAIATVTFALSYNRWGWVVLVALALLMLVPAREGRRTATGDGLMLGAGLAFLALLKMTYFLALVLPALVWLLSGRRWRTLGIAAAVGLAAMAAVTIWAGPSFWLAYLRDLAIVANSEVRPRPGMPFAEILASPNSAMASIALLGGIMVLRLSGLKTQGLVLLTLLPGVLYVTFQNWGNAPVWLVALAIALAEARSRLSGDRRVAGLPARTALGGLALIALTHVAPFATNMLASPLRHLGASREAHVDPIVRPGWDDLLFLKDRGALSLAQVPLILPAEVPEDPRAAAELLPVTFMGRSFGACLSTSGFIAQMRARAEGLRAVPGLDPGRVLNTDLVNVTWLFAGGEPLPGGSPWYYGGRRGFDAADWVFVPACPNSPQARAIMLAELEDAGWTFRERWAGEAGAIYERIR